jgi:hypothetical protein
MAWSPEDRGALLALRQEQAETCPKCGHPISECRDPSTAQQWTVVQEVCQPSRIAEAVAENNSHGEVRKRGIVLKTVRNRG